MREEVMHRRGGAVDATSAPTPPTSRSLHARSTRSRHKRAELNKLRVVMLYRMHRVLDAEQNTKFQAMIDRWEAERKKQDGDHRR